LSYPFKSMDADFIFTSFNFFSNNFKINFHCT
jgi:hypothetical protein